VIVLTSYSGAQQIVGTSVLGRRDFIHKPYDYQELLEKIENVIRKDG
jgi:FixJ family two-component response regulator